MNKSNTALLLIDIQLGLFCYSGAELNKPGNFLNVIKSLIEYAKKKNYPIIYVQHESSGEKSILHPSQPGWIIHPDISPDKNDHIIHKKFNDSFKNTDLNQVLQDLKIETLIIGGLQTELCVDTTVRSAFSNNYKVIVIKEGHTSYDNEILKADLIIKHHNQIFNGRFGKVIPMEKLN